MCVQADAMMAQSPSSQVSLKQDDGQLSMQGLPPPRPAPHCPAGTQLPFCRRLLAFKTFQPQSPWRAVGSPEREPQMLEPSIFILSEDIC